MCVMCDVRDVRREIQEERALAASAPPEQEGEQQEPGPPRSPDSYTPEDVKLLIYSRLPVIEAACLQEYNRQDMYNVGVA